MDRIGNINIIQSRRCCRKRKHGTYRKILSEIEISPESEILPETEILNICSKRKLIPESEILNIVRIGNKFRNREFNWKRVVRIRIGRDLLAEGPARSQPYAQQAQAPKHTLPSHARPSARPGPAMALARAGLRRVGWRYAWAARPACGASVSLEVCYSNPKATGICHMIKSNPKRFSLFN